MYTKKRNIRCLLAVMSAGVATLAAACGSSSSGSSASGSDPTTITIVYGAPVADHMIPAITEAAGIFAQYGIKVKTEFLAATELMPALISGQVQFVSVPAPDPEEAALNGQQIVEVAQWEDSFDAELVATSKYPTVASLNGKTTSVSKPGDFNSLLATMADQKYGITLQDLPLGSLPDQITAYESGQVDSVPALSPWQLSQVQQKVPGTHVLVNWQTVKNVPGIEFVGYGPWLSSHSSTAIKVLKALNAGIAYFKTHEAASVSVISKVTGEPEATAEAAYADVIASLSPTIVPSESEQQTVLNDIASQFPAAKTFDAAKLIDTSYALQATK
jgi:ABC-type nitrate/sulfonate/bicarbonate transport system substrate-binding protein